MIEFYLNKVQDRFSISDEIITMQTHPFLKNHLKTMLTRDFSNKQALLIENHQYLNELLSFTSICMTSSSTDACLTRIFTDPMSINNVFVPFMPNVNEDLMY